MPYRTTYTAATVAEADHFAATLGMDASHATEGLTRANFKGRFVERQIGSVEFEFYGSNRDHAAFEHAFEAARAARVAPARSHGTDAATEKQIALLHRLIDRDPAAAMTVGASPDGARVADGLTKRDASRMIEQLINGV